MNQKTIADKMYSNMFHGGVNKLSKKRLCNTLVGIIAGSFLIVNTIIGYDIGRCLLEQGYSKQQIEDIDFDHPVFKTVTRPGRELAYLFNNRQNDKNN